MKREQHTNTRRTTRHQAAGKGATAPAQPRVPLRALRGLLLLLRWLARHHRLLGLVRGGGLRRGGLVQDCFGRVRGSLGLGRVGGLDLGLGHCCVRGLVGCLGGCLLSRTMAMDLAVG